MVAIAIADRQRAEQHLLRRHSDEWTDDAMHARPGFLGAGIEAVAARQIHQGVDVTAEIGPLARPKPAIDGDEQRDRRVEERVIAFVLSKPRRDIVASDLKRAVKLRAKMLAARFVRLPHCLGIDRIFRFEYWLLTRVAAGDRHRDLPLELGERRSGERINLPRLQIAAGSRARRMCDQVAHQFRGTNGTRSGNRRLQRRPWRDPPRRFSWGLIAGSRCLCVRTGAEGAARPGLRL